MLLLTRREKQSIIINGNIRVKVLKFLDGEVEIGVEAPPNVSVNREEIEKKKIKINQNRY